MSTEEKEIVETEEKVEETKEEPSLEEQIEKLKEELAQATNNYYKAYADADNLKKRLQQEAEMTRKYRIQSFALEILPVIDNLERALNQPTTDESFKKGVEMIYQQLIHALKNEGVEEVDALNKPFDANFHHAIMQEKVEGVESNMVVEVLQKGYVLKDRILRAALVKVSE
ncbi:MAG: nucleotide exchange factor GrpE [Erysipelotrichaceae bacterium]|nr:nucleotide exchange factor GrpE [Erysipelotrichaceae bacterium]